MQLSTSINCIKQNDSLCFNIPVLLCIDCALIIIDVSCCHGLLSSPFSSIILCIYLSMSTLYCPKDSSLYHSTKPMLFYASEMVVSNTKLLYSHTCVSRVENVLTAAKFLSGCHLLRGMYISTLLITISNDVATNPGPGINVAQQLSSFRGQRWTKYACTQRWTKYACC